MTCCGRLGHLGHHRHLAEVDVAQQPGFFLAQRQDFADQRTVVKLDGVAFGLVRGARDVGAVQHLAQALRVANCITGR
jgi:hypothetical protein